MHLVVSVHDHETLLTVTGSVDDVDVPRLRNHILESLEADRGDVVLDMRQAMTVSDHLMPALTAARSRAKHLRLRIVVVDGPDGATTGGLRRLGMQFRIPIYRDPAEAAEGLQADREARARLTLGGRVTPSHSPVTRSDTENAGPDGEAPEPSARAGRALWAASARPPGSAMRP